LTPSNITDIAFTLSPVAGRRVGAVCIFPTPGPEVNAEKNKYTPVTCHWLQDEMVD